MRKRFLLNILLLIAIIAFSQPRPKQKDKPPTQKEMAELMMDNMGVKIPSIKNAPAASDAQFARVLKNEIQIAPKKDAARIVTISKEIIDSKMGACIAAIQSQLASVLKLAGIKAC